MKRLLPALLLSLTAACGGAKIEKQRKEIEDLQTKAGAFYTQLQEKADEIGALKTSKAGLETRVVELEARVVELEGRSAAAEGRAATLAKSNKSLSDAIGASKDELGEKLNAVVAEKDELARKFSDAVKEKLALERLKSVYQAAREKAGREMSKLKEEREALASRLSAAQDAFKKTDAEARQAGEARAAVLLKTREEMGAAADAVLAEMQAGRALVEQSGETFTIALSDAALFEDGSVKITEPGAALLARVGAALKALPSKSLRVEAHSDNAPFKKGLLGGYAGHWELTAARAAAVARWLHEHAGLDPERLSAAGFGEFRPAKPNDTAEGRAANRRVALVVAPMRPQ
ncbi:MAG: OmpA family protein [Elusimicrobia bacterium]|nr:OmpA family protein [Elusimicrobiota bacterium]